ncbi:MAG: FAD-dependent oxidoreductase [Tepidisphaera sp.]|nr:FAD-dependent oxidoreductase [Tepidisphaera sp.]
MSDVIVIGSGAAGVCAAWPLVQRGLRVTMIDVGVTDQGAGAMIPAEPWSKLRRSDANQHLYFLGERFEGVPDGKVRVGAQISPPRAYVAADAPRLLPRDAPGFVGLESVAQGGLASAWGAAVSPWASEDLAGLPVTLEEMKPHYDGVAELIGVSGQAGDDLSAHLHDSPSMMPPLEMDTPSRAVFEAYLSRREEMKRAGLALGHARLAACSREHRRRGPQPYHDMDFWSDHGESVYRPRYTLRELLEAASFESVTGRLATRFESHASGVVVQAVDLATGRGERFEAAHLVLAAGALGTTRIVLRSLGKLGVRRPLVSNHSPYFPMLNTRVLGKESSDRRHSLTQITGFYRPGGAGAEAEPVQLQCYSYRSLLLFKLLKEVPLALANSRRIFQALTPAMSVLAVHHADEPSAEKWVSLEADEGVTEAGVPRDRLRIRYEATKEETQRQHRTEREVLGLFRRLGCYTLHSRAVRLGPGASIHYAGPLPMRASPGEMECDGECRLSGHPRVRVADSAVFARLPAKGVTFSMMANAHRVGTLLAGEIGGGA